MEFKKSSFVFDFEDKFLRVFDFEIGFSIFENGFKIDFLIWKLTSEV